MAEGGIPGDGPDSHIIAGVIDGMRQSFIDSGVDLDVLAKLEHLWVSKLSSSSSAGLAMADVMVPGSKAGKKEAGKLIAQKKVALPAFKKTDAKDYDSSDEIVIVTDSDNDDPAEDQLEAASVAVSPAKKKANKRQKILQVDGPADSSDEEDAADDDEDGDDDDDSDDDDIDPDGEEDEGVEEEPLASDDDISDEDPSDLFETHNVIVCQYDKITRAKNKWKFHLKDGIMNLNGKDYVFFARVILSY